MNSFSDNGLNTHLTNAYAKFEIIWMITFPDNGQKPRTNGRSDGHTDGRTLTIPMSPPDFVDGDKNNIDHRKWSVDVGWVLAYIPLSKSVSQSVSHLLTQVPNTHPPIILPRQVLHYRPLHWGIMGGITLSFSWWWILNTFRTDCVLVKVHLYP